MLILIIVVPTASTSLAKTIESCTSELNSHFLLQGNELYNYSEIMFIDLPLSINADTFKESKRTVRHNNFASV